tara:strand:- start:254 stop:793 length:540 start_codon:yes stop_codon:yes gene_type:complete
MIAECIIFLALLNVNDVESTETINQVSECVQLIPKTMIQHLPLYYQFFDEENLYTATRIGWCESRGKSNAYRKEDQDSGLMQFIPRTWKWIAEEYDIPVWDTQILTYHGMPWELTDYDYYFAGGFAYSKVQNVSYYNIKAASHLAEDIYNRTQWRDWNSSKWCWGNPKYYEKRWREEGF